jgi:hypothetical protein
MSAAIRIAGRDANSGGFVEKPLTPVRLTPGRPSRTWVALRQDAVLAMLRILANPLVSAGPGLLFAGLSRVILEGQRATPPRPLEGLGVALQEEQRCPHSHTKYPAESKGRDDG